MRLNHIYQNEISEVNRLIHSAFFLSIYYRCDILWKKIMPKSRLYVLDLLTTQSKLFQSWAVVLSLFLINFLSWKTYLRLIQLILINQSNLQLLNFVYKRLFNKPYENEVTLTRQNPTSKCCYLLEILTEFKRVLIIQNT